MNEERVLYELGDGMLICESATGERVIDDNGIERELGELGGCLVEQILLLVSDLEDRTQALEGACEDLSRARAEGRLGGMQEALSTACGCDEGDTWYAAINRLIAAAERELAGGKEDQGG